MKKADLENLTGKAGDLIKNLASDPKKLAIAAIAVGQVRAMQQDDPAYYVRFSTSLIGQTICGIASGLGSGLQGATDEFWNGFVNQVKIDRDYFAQELVGTGTAQVEERKKELQEWQDRYFDLFNEHGFFIYQSKLPDEQLILDVNKLIEKNHVIIFTTAYYPLKRGPGRFGLWQVWYKPTVRQNSTFIFLDNIKKFSIPYYNEILLPHLYRIDHDGKEEIKLPQETPIGKLLDPNKIPDPSGRGKKDFLITIGEIGCVGLFFLELPAIVQGLGSLVQGVGEIVPG